MIFYDYAKNSEIFSLYSHSKERVEKHFNTFWQVLAIFDLLE